MVKIFADTANMAEIRTFLDWGVCDGVTTNQKIFLAEGGVDFKQRVLEICSSVHGPVSVETTANTVPSLLEEGRRYARWDPKVVVKVAMYGNGNGLRVASQLHKEGIKVNMTCIMSFNQLMLACKAGARYISLFYNRVKDSGEDPISVIKKINTVLRRDGYDSELIVGSIRKPADIEEAFEAGADIVTIPYKILTQMPFHFKTEETIKEFDDAWKKFSELPAPVQTP